MKPAFSSAFLVGFLALGGVTAFAQGNSGAVVPDHYIVELQPGAIPATVAAQHGIAPNFIYGAAVNGFAGFIPPGILRQLQADPAVALIVPDREVFAIGKPSGGTVARQPQVVPAGVQRIGGGTIMAAGVGVAVVDTGLDTSHPDLTVSPTYFSAIRSTTGKDDNGHGTHVGGIIAANNDGFDVVGVAPNTTLYAVKVLDRRGSGWESGVIAGLDWIAQNHASVTPNILVVNMSLGRAGSIGDSPTYRSTVQSLESAGITVVVAAGNDCGAEISQMVPACYPEVIAVSSTTALNGSSSYPGFAGIPADTASYFTTDGAGVAIAAPGEDQENVSQSGFLSSVGILSTKLGGGTTRMSGTSMACPHVAGVAALIYAADTGATPTIVRYRIKDSASGGVPLASPTGCYTFDGFKEGVVSVEAATYPYPD